MRKEIKEYCVAIFILIASIISNKSYGQCNLTSYTISPSGYLCGVTSGSVTMSGSQTGVTYQLEGNSGFIGSPVAGTGSAITWSNMNYQGGQSYAVVAIAASGVFNCSTVSATNPVLVAPPTYINTIVQLLNSDVQITASSGVLYSGDSIIYTVVPSPTGNTQQSIKNIQLYAGSYLGSPTTGNTLVVKSPPPPQIGGYFVMVNSAVCGSAMVPCPPFMVRGQKPSIATNPSAFPSNQNYIVTYTATAPINAYSIINNMPITDVKTSIQYFDALGRPTQTVAKQGSLETSTNTSRDLVATVTYDAYGRKQADLLPYVASGGDGSFKTDAISAQPAYYNSTTNPIAGQGETGANAKDSILYENSPLNRVTKTMAPGNNWVGAGRGVQAGYWVNTATDSVRIWNIAAPTAVPSGFATPTNAGMYAAGLLYKSIATDEAGHQVIEFKDKQNHVVLKKVQNTAAIDAGTGSGHNGWLCTYYIYDDYDNLRCVINPAGVQTLLGNGWSLSSTILAEQCLRYEYDLHSRMVMKQSPGAGAVYMVYNIKDLLVMTQDFLMRKNGKWLVTVYDTLTRPVQTKLITDANSLSYHLPLASNSTTYPASSVAGETLTITHYDDYTGLPSGLSSTLSSAGGWSSYTGGDTNSFPYPVAINQITPTGTPVSTKGLVTWTQTEVLGSNGTKYLTSVSIYDNKSRVIQTQSQNYSGGIDVTTTQYTWGGQPLVVVQSQQKGGTNGQTTVTISSMTYDVLNRLTATTKRVQNTLVGSNALSSTINVSTMQYDALGELKVKRVGNTRSGSSYTANPLDTMLYEYNIRGWLLGVNRAYVKNTATADASNNTGENFTTPLTYAAGGYFGFELGYDKNPSVANGNWTSSLQYTGNITGMIWKSQNDGQIRKYDFSYDNVNRLTAAQFTQYNNTSGSTGFNTSAGTNYSVSNLTYDANGNILTMNQYGLASATATSSVLVDQLSYTYISGTNRLQTVTDAANANTPAPGVAGYLGDYHYASGASAGATYTYDGNGNLTSDANKNISLIYYNVLNLPDSIVVTNKGYIKYYYDAVGDKLEKKTVEGSTTTITLYDGGIVYKNDTLQFISTEEGRVRPIPPSGGGGASWVVDYYLKDHLGSVRVVLTDDPALAANPVLEANSYYPMGLPMAVLSKISSTVHNRYGYQGKEMQNQEWADGSGLNAYDFEARYYDPQLGVWHNQDPAGQYASPYLAMGDTWPNGIDPNGESFGSSIGHFFSHTVVHGLEDMGAFVALGGIGYLGASIESHGHWDVSGWNNNWWKGAITADLVAGAAAVGVADIAAPAALTGLLGTAGTSIAVGAATGVAQNMLMTEMGSLTSGHGLSWDWNDMFVATTTGAITGAFQSPGMQKAIDGDIWGMTTTVDAAGNVTKAVNIPQGLSFLKGVPSNIIGSVLSTAVSGASNSSWRGVFDVSSQFPAAMGSAMGQIAHNFISVDNVGKLIGTFSKNVLSNYANALGQQIGNNLFGGSYIFHQMFYGYTNANNTLPNTAQGWGMDTMFPDVY
jgi:RHS repeat-associated protein